MWAAVVDGTGVHAARAESPLVHPPAAGAVHSGAGGTLTPRSAVGSARDIRWKLHFDGAWRHHEHVPATVDRLGLSGRTYTSAATDLRVSGTLTAGGRTWRLDHAPAVCGHIYGARSTTDGWAWAHCAAFDGRPDVTFEGIAARLRPGGVALPTATSILLRRGTRTHSFTRLRQIFRVDSQLGTRTWRFHARDRTLDVTGEASLPDPAACVRVRYTHANGEQTWVQNSPLCALNLAVFDRRTRERDRLTSVRASFERAERTAFREPPHLAG